MLSGAGKSINIYGGKVMSEPAYSFDAHEEIVNVAKFSPSGLLVVSGGEDRFLKIHSI